MSWKDDKPSQKQLDFCKNNRLKKPKTKGEASELITAFIKDNKLSSKANTDKYERKHGWDSIIGNGAIHYTYGVMDYCDDGNGNTWCSADDHDCYGDYEDGEF